MKKIVVDGIEYKPVKKEGDIKIVVLQRGWIGVGHFSREGSDCKLENSHIIRNWGTTKGLGEISINGPTAKTVLDKNYGLVEFDYLTVVVCISCDEAKWQNVL